MLTSSAAIYAQRDRRDRLLWVVGLFLIGLLLEFTTPVDYVFGYLYIGPIVLANSSVGRRTTLVITIAAAVLTMANVWIPAGEAVRPATLANRAIAVLALLVTGLLSDRVRRSEEAIAAQQSRLQAQEQLARVREDFTSTLAHDLKTPLLGAIETVEAFQQEKFGVVQSSQRKVLETIVRSHRTSLQLVETLLDVYRNDIEGLALNRSPLDLVKIAADVTDTLINLAASRRVSLTMHYGESDFRRSLWVDGDAFQLGRVFANLITNAINHSLRGGRVEIVLESTAAGQTVKILDSGAGITPEELPLLFERFYQGHSDRVARGSGLGLYLSRQIIEAHGGIIWAERRLNSNHQPIGALFGFRLPACPQPPAA